MSSKARWDEDVKEFDEQHGGAVEEPRPSACQPPVYVQERWTEKSFAEAFYGVEGSEPKHKASSSDKKHEQGAWGQLKRRSMTPRTTRSPKLATRTIVVSSSACTGWVGLKCWTEASTSCSAKRSLECLSSCCPATSKNLETQGQGAWAGTLTR